VFVSKYQSVIEISGNKVSFFQKYPNNQKKVMQ
jgi:hypothetical protein